MPTLDLAGQRFGRLVVLSLVGVRRYQKANHRIWGCQCDCGNQVSVIGGHLQRGRTKSCGCLNKELSRKRMNGNGYAVKHGYQRRGREHPLYAIWKMMWQRCINSKCKSYPYYGGRGIMVCDRWRDLSAFAADMGERPSPQHSIDRIDNDGNYEPGNCRWATYTEQWETRRPHGAAKLAVAC